MPFRRSLVLYVALVTVSALVGVACTTEANTASPDAAASSSVECTFIKCFDYARFAIEGSARYERLVTSSATMCRNDVCETVEASRAMGHVPFGVTATSRTVTVTWLVHDDEPEMKAGDRYRLSFEDSAGTWVKGEREASAPMRVPCNDVLADNSPCGYARGSILEFSTATTVDSADAAADGSH